MTIHYLFGGEPVEAECPIPPGTFGWALRWFSAGTERKMWCLNAHAVLTEYGKWESVWESVPWMREKVAEVEVWAMTHDGDVQVDIEALKLWAASP